MSREQLLKLAGSGVAGLLVVGQQSSRSLLAAGHAAGISAGQNLLSAGLAIQATSHAAASDTERGANPNFDLLGLELREASALVPADARHPAQSGGDATDPISSKCAGPFAILAGNETIAAKRHAAQTPAARLGAAITKTGGPFGFSFSNHDENV